MGTTIYEIIQDWHELHKNGTISEQEFNLKKQELLNIEKRKSENQQKQTVNDKIEFKKSGSFFNNVIFYTLGIICVGILLIFLYYRNSNSEQLKDEDNTIGIVKNDPILGNYIVDADNSNLVHFYKEPDFSTEKKAYFSTKDTVYVSKIENGFGYVRFTNSNGQKSIGWLQLEKMNYCEECMN